MKDDFFAGLACPVVNQNQSVANMLSLKAATEFDSMIASDCPIVSVHKSILSRGTN
jgi:hypothetical protein